MNDKSYKVKDIYIKQVDTYIDMFVRLLIRYNVNYLQIDNEIHFNNRIYRFYETKNESSNIQELYEAIFELTKDGKDIQYLLVGEKYYDKKTKYEKINHRQKIKKQNKDVKNIICHQNELHRENKPIVKRRIKEIKKYSFI